MTERELECPACYGIVRIAETDRDQIEPCQDCRRLYSVTFAPTDGPHGWRAGWTLRECEPPDWRDVQGCLRYHGGL